MRVFLAGFLLTIFSFQILPIRAIGKILFKAQLTEELHEHEEDAEDADDPFGPEFFPKFKEFSPGTPLLTDQLAYREWSIARRNIGAIQRSLFLEDQHYPDIFVPPPNA
jgi:hypothetical protein